MNPIVAIASFCPACCCTVDSWTLIKGLIRFSSPEGHNKLKKSQYNLTQTPGNLNALGGRSHETTARFPIDSLANPQIKHKMGLVSSSQGSSYLKGSQSDSSGLSNVKTIQLLSYGSSVATQVRQSYRCNRPWRPIGV